MLGAQGGWRGRCRCGGCAESWGAAAVCVEQRRVCRMQSQLVLNGLPFWPRVPQSCRMPLPSPSDSLQATAAPQHWPHTLVRLSVCLSVRPSVCLRGRLPVAAPAAIFSCTPGGLPSCGANIILNWSCTANLKATSGMRRATLAPLPRYSACVGASVGRERGGSGGRGGVKKARVMGGWLGGRVPSGVWRVWLHTTAI